MTKKQLLPLLIAHYEKAIQEVIENDWNDTWYDVMRKYNVYNGICYCAQKSFNTNIYDKKWVEKASQGISYWYKMPCAMATKEQNIERLQYRLDKMKKSVNK